MDKKPPPLLVLDDESREMYAAVLERMAQSIREGKMTLTRFTQTRPTIPVYDPALERTEYFRTEDTTLSFNYCDKRHKEEEVVRLKAYLKANPHVEVCPRVPEG